MKLTSLCKILWGIDFRLVLMGRMILVWVKLRLRLRSRLRLGLILRLGLRFRSSYCRGLGLNLRLRMRLKFGLLRFVFWKEITFLSSMRFLSFSPTLLRKTCNLLRIITIITILIFLSHNLHILPLLTSSRLLRNNPQFILQPIPQFLLLIMSFNFLI